MPIPTADSYDRATQTPNTDNGGQARLTSTEANPSGQAVGTTTHSTAASSRYSYLQGEQTGRPLSKEEADRLYEERMEEEYAKREGGA